MRLRSRPTTALAALLLSIAVAGCGTVQSESDRAAAIAKKNGLCHDELLSKEAAEECEAKKNQISYTKEGEQEAKEGHPCSENTLAAVIEECEAAKKRLASKH